MLTTVTTTDPILCEPTGVDGIGDIQRANPCDDWRYMRGLCDHGTERWAAYRCKRRQCSGCSVVRRWELASKIANGVRFLTNNAGELGGWLVLTYADPESAKPQFKKRAVRLENSFIKWLRREQKKRGNPTMEYAKTWEIQPTSKRLHTNLVCAPWAYIPQAVLRARWGARISVNRIVDDATIADEAVKRKSIQGLSLYMSKKLSQAVPESWHRAVSFSRGWPKAPPDAQPERVGNIEWVREHDLRREEPGALGGFFGARALGWWAETVDGSGEFVSLMHPEGCDCFEFKDGRSSRLDPPGAPGAPPDVDILGDLQRRVLEDWLS